jgi:hypothetical protein
VTNISVNGGGVLDIFDLQILFLVTLEAPKSSGTRFAARNYF